MFLFVLFLAVTAAHAIRYDGYQSLSIGPLTSRHQAEVVDSLRDERDASRQVLLLSDRYATGQPVDILVSPERLSDVKRLLTRTGLAFDVIDSDVQKTIDENRALNAKAREAHQVKARKARAAAERPPVPEYYMEYDEMEQWMLDTVAEAQALGVDVTIEETGRSHENRPIYIVTVNGDSTDKPKVFLDAGIHAREWIGHATAIWIMHEILLGTSDDAVDMRTNYEFYLSPVLNPDGYEYTWTNDRFWRKNREPNEGSACVGTDLNRNWDANWSVCGVSRNPCDDTYSGSAAASCIETQHAAAAIEARSTDLDLYITIHSYSQLWLVPWGGSEEKSSDYDDLMVAAEAAVAAVEAVDGRVFQAGTVPDLLYCGSGGSFDWVKNGNPSYDLEGTGLGVKYGFAPELRPATAAGGGFDIPPENIDPSGREIFAGVVASVKAVYG